MTGRRSAPSLPDDAAPTGLKFLWRWRCYKYAAPVDRIGLVIRENSPAIYGWEYGQPNFQVPSGTADHFFRP
jgi:hypothetical protein